MDWREEGAAPRRTRNLKKAAARTIVATGLAIVALAIVAPAAWAHTGNAKITCKKVSYSYSDFPNWSGNTVHETVYVNGIEEHSDTYTFNGPTGESSIAIIVVGSATVQADARWNTNDVKGSFKVIKNLTGCSGIQ